MKLMAVMAHPDDAEIWCGGTLILHTQKGDDVTICSLAYGPESERGTEGKAGAEEMGCRIEFLGLEDAAIRDTAPAVERLSRILDSFRPDAIITHWFDDMHPDHEGAFRILRRALVASYLADPETYFASFPRVFCCDTYHSIGFHGPFVPDRYVDVSSVWEGKIRALRVHRSQNVEYFVELTDMQCTAHGQTAGTAKAEGFLYIPMFGRHDEGEMLGGRFGAAFGKRK